MAALNDLINQVEDKTLRERLMQEAARLTKQKKFGLVFEEHIPECTPLYGIEIKRGSTVAKKAGAINDVYRVIKINSDEAECLRLASGEKETIALSELVPVAKFGEPIYPTLQPIDKVENAPDSDLWHTLIEADNYHALQLLEYLYPKQVDCIYIDPPYNTGARDWKYNNDYVDSSDSYRHSKWLSMMQKRLKIAKRILNPNNSVLIVTIDEKEYLHLGCLLEEMFPEANITMVTDIINPRAGVARPGSFTRNQEYLYYVQIGVPSIVPDKQEGVEKKNPIWFSLMRTGSNSSRSDRPNLFYPVWVYPNGKLHSIGDLISITDDKDTVSAPEAGLIAIWPLRPDGRENTWQLGRESLAKAFDTGCARVSTFGKKMTLNYLRTAEKRRIEAGEIIVKGHDANGALILEHNEDAVKTKAPEAVWNRPLHDAGIYGSTLLNSIFLERRFSFPKSLYAVEDAIRYCVGNSPNALVVDFFAGSGTTLHAVNLLNAEDGGHRRCIMVTNNEVSADEAKSLAKQGYQPGDPEWEKLGIARYVTWPRTVCSIEGHDVNGNPLKGDYLANDADGNPIPMSQGFKANCEYFKLGFLDKDDVALGRQFKEILPLLWLKAGAIGKRPELCSEVPDMLILPENKFAVLISESSFMAFDEQLNAHPEIDTVFIVTDSEKAYREMISGLRAKHTYQLYRSYLDNFRINARR
ncbi:DNA methyltransferase [Clostridium sp. KNHs216]|uniref:site-specific DNA-methyltransferase n=1 Tax=Clostridium sp. KNHs216 TaxID=1550235 RepID=UPI00114EF729|nr:DNA methyltransferase [Clostridium sp. KNHs216]TQI67347.1 adenine-specific DNA-methyltransferase [Clostridium sp. KNHs216]